MYFHDIGDFLEEISACDNPENDLKKENIIARFLDFTRRTKGLDREYFSARLNETGAELLDIQTIDDFIYRHCLYFYSDASAEYRNDGNNLEKALNFLTDAKIWAVNRCQEIKKSLPDGAEKEDLQYKKFGYYIDYLAYRIKIVKNKLTDKKKRIRQAIKKARTDSWFAWQSTEFYFTETLLDHAVLNGQDYVLFGIFPVPLTEKLRFLRKENHNLYIKLFAEKIDEYSVAQNLTKICEGNYYLNPRLDIIRSAQGLFERG